MNPLITSDHIKAVMTAGVFALGAGLSVSISLMEIGKFLIITTGAIIFLKRIRKPSFLPEAKYVIGISAFLLVWLVLSSIVMSANVKVVVRWAGLIAMFFGIIFADKKDMRIGAWGLFVGGGVAGIVGLYQMLVFKHRGMGFHDYQILLAHALVSAFVIGIAFFMKVIKWKKWLSLIWLIFIFAGIISTGSRLAVITVGFSSAMLIILSIKRKGFALGVVFFLLGIALIVPAYTSETLRKTLSKFGFPPSLTYGARERKCMWKATVDIIKENPVWGVGIDRWKENMKGRCPPNIVALWKHFHPHNNYLTVASELGIPAGASVIFLTILGFVAGFRKMKNAKGNRVATACELSVFTAVNIQGFLDFTMFGVVGGPLFWGTLAHLIISDD